MKNHRIMVPVSNRVLLKFWNIMRLSLFSLFLFVTQTYATNSYSEQTRPPNETSQQQQKSISGKVSDLSGSA